MSIYKRNILYGSVNINSFLLISPSIKAENYFQLKENYKLFTNKYVPH